VIDVRFATTEVSDEELERLQSALNEAEAARALRFHFERDRRRAIVSRGTLRELLARDTGRAPREVDIIDDARGKPALRTGEIAFNVSHSHELIAIALADGAVGIDIEWIRPMGADAMRIARAHFSLAEIDRLEAAPDGDDAFFAIWTAKEAVVKAAGGGLSIDLRSFTVPDAGEAFEPVEGVEGWLVRRAEAPVAGYRVAVAALK
jgi:4'-phosphopantetheinyl transferase